MSSPFQEPPYTVADADVHRPESTQPVLSAGVELQETVAEGQVSQEVSVFAIERNCERDCTLGSV